MNIMQDLYNCIYYRRPFLFSLLFAYIYLCSKFVYTQCYSLGVEDFELLSGEELHTPNSFLIIFNGLILGKHRKPQVKLVLK